VSSEPRPADPRRLWDTIDRIDARYVDGDTVELTVTVRYSPWCCNGTHEIADAITALDTALHHARVCSHAWVTDPDDITAPDSACQQCRDTIAAAGPRTGSPIGTTGDLPGSQADQSPCPCLEKNPAHVR
jgi:hypothetical protein